MNNALRNQEITPIVMSGALNWFTTLMLGRWQSNMSVCSKKTSALGRMAPLFQAYITS